MTRALLWGKIIVITCDEVCTGKIFSFISIAYFIIKNCWCNSNIYVHCGNNLIVNDEYNILKLTLFYSFTTSIMIFEIDTILVIFKK